jgi:uncharacterized protein involved in response to NO
MSLAKPILTPEPQSRSDHKFALWELGFRPFYLLASGFSALSIAVWGMQFSGLLKHAYLQGPLWHAHEMLFGFALAVVVGFLFTAGRNWTGQPTPTGAWLAALAALWVAGRVLVLTPFAWTAALVNTAFPVAAAVTLAVPFIKAGNRRNYFFVGLLLLLALGQLGVHLSVLGVVKVPGWAGIGLALDVMLFVLAVMGGRVIPMFTNNGVSGAKASKHPMVEKLALGLVLLILVADVMHLSGPWFVLMAWAAATAHMARFLLWHPWKTLPAPLVWVLHMAYAWIPVHLALRGFAELSWVPVSVATHALTAGAIGCMVIGMMTRTALGHTGRMLIASRMEISCYVLVGLAALVRVAMPIVAPSLIYLAVIISSVLWSCGFGLYAIRYWPILTRARSDSLPG